MITITNGLWSSIRDSINQNFSDLSADSHNHLNRSILDSTEEPYTTAEKTKLGNLSERFRGVYINETAIKTANPPTAASGGYYALNIETNTLWSFQYDVNAENGIGNWVDSGVNTAGDMLASIYDPNNIGANAFDRSNHSGVQSQDTVDGLEERLSAIEGNQIYQYEGSNAFADGDSSTNQTIEALPGLDTEFEIQWDISNGGNSANIEVCKKISGNSFSVFARWSQISNGTSSSDANVGTDNNSASSRVMQNQGDLLRISHHVSFSNLMAAEIVELIIIPDDVSDDNIYRYEIIGMHKSGDNNGRCYIKQIG